MVYYEQEETGEHSRVYTEFGEGGYVSDKNNKKLMLLRLCWGRSSDLYVFVGIILEEVDWFKKQNSV